MSFMNQADQAYIEANIHRLAGAIAILKREDADFEAGYRDRKAGFYDKWYRRYRPDEGAAYDRGVVACVNAGDVNPDENFFLIECRA